MPAKESTDSAVPSPLCSSPVDHPNAYDSDDSVKDKTYMPVDSSETDDSEVAVQDIVGSREPVGNRRDSDDIEHISKATRQERAGENDVRKSSRAIRRERTSKIHSGQRYVGVSGNVVMAREMKDLKDCRKKCKTYLSIDIRKSIFDEYWSLGSHDKRVAFIANLINSKEKQVTRKRKAESLKNREITLEYFLEVNGKRISVCKDCFCRTLDEKQKFIKLAVKNKLQSTSGIIVCDRRGKTASVNKKTEEEINEVRVHIASFPAYESHYTRRTNDKKYLQSHLNLSIMYDLYKEGKSNPVGRPIYQREFHKQNLSFKKPQVDTCFKCDTLHMKVQVATSSTNQEEKVCAEKDLQIHQEQANSAYEAKKANKEEARADHTKKCYSFDLQQCLPTPFIGSSVAFYKRQLWTYNLTVHDNATGESMNYMWHEALACRGGNEIASCLYQHIQKLPAAVAEITFFSDTCAGQNKNSHVSAIFLKAQSEFPHLIINHKFLVPGHTHMECDVDHSMIEKEKKKMEVPVYHPHDWYQLVRRTGRKKKFKVHEMQQEEFFDFAALLKTVLVNRKKNNTGEPFSWHSVQWLQYKEEGVVHYKNTLNSSEEFKVLSFKRRGKPSSLKHHAIKRRYNKLLPIAPEKKRDLCSLLVLIPPLFHDFYKNLPTSETVTDIDPDLVDFVED